LCCASFAAIAGPPGQWCFELPDRSLISLAYAKAKDSDGDQRPDIIDNCPSISNLNQTDVDQDSIGDVCDNCPYVANPDQKSSEDSGVGVACSCQGPTATVIDRDGCMCPSDGGGSPSDSGLDCGVVLRADAGP
jgi:hypothetical protein